MSESTGTIIRMAGEKMEVLLEAGCVTQCAPAIVGRLPEIMHKICRTLNRYSVAHTFIKEIRIGETAALIDKVGGYACRIRMEAHAVRVLEIYETKNQPAVSVQAVYLVNGGLLRAVAGRKAVAA